MFYFWQKNRLVDKEAFTKLVYLMTPKAAFLDNECSNDDKILKNIIFILTSLSTCNYNSIKEQRNNLLGMEIVKCFAPLGRGYGKRVKNVSMIRLFETLLIQYE